MIALPTHPSYRLQLIAFLLCALLSVACGENASTTPAAALVVRLEVPEGPDPFEGMVSLRLEASSPDFPEVVEKVVQHGTPVVELPEVRYGHAWVLAIEGYDAQNQVIARGRSASFDLTVDSPREVHLPLIPLERFTLATSRLALARYAHSASLLPDGRVLVAGGFTTDGAATNSVEIYEPISGTFKSAPPLSHPRGAHRAFLVDGSLVLVGGRDGRDAVRSVEIYAWADGGTREVVLQSEREDVFAAMLRDGTILVAGGRDDKGKIVESTELIDPANASRSNGPSGGPDQHGGFAFTLDDGRVIAAGGWTGPPVGLGTRSWIYQNSSWSQGPALGVRREGGRVAVTTNQQVIIAGGEGGSGVVQAVQTFSGGDFVTVGQTTASFREHAMVALGDRALIAGGADGPDVEIWQDGALQPAGRLVRARRLFTLTALTDGTVLAIGGRVAGAATDETELFMPR